MQRGLLGAVPAGAFDDEEGVLYNSTPPRALPQTYEGHHMAVYAVRWNPFHPRVFISCSAGETDAHACTPDAFRIHSDTALCRLDR